MIQPKGAASYGFSLYRGACPQAADSEIIACKSGFPEIEGRAVGIATNPQASFQQPNGTAFIPSIDAQVGETYFLLVDNFSDNGIGFDLIFGGMAAVGDETVRSQIVAPATIDCNQPTIHLDVSHST